MAASAPLPRVSWNGQCHALGAQPSLGLRTFLSGTPRSACASTTSCVVDAPLLSPVPPRPKTPEALCHAICPDGNHSRSRSSPLPPVGDELGWRADFSDIYVRKQLLGSGAYGEVYAAVERGNDFPVAVKTVPKLRPNKGPKSRPKTIAKIRKEMDVLRRLQGAHGVIRFHGAYEDPEHMHIVTELCRGGDMADLAAEAGPLTEPCLSYAAKEIFQVLASVHGRGMVHCDIKPSNFCLRTAVTVPSPGCGMVLPGQALSVERGSPPNPFAGNVRIIDVGTAQDLPQQEVQVELPEQRKCAQERVRGIHRRACAQPLAARNRSRVGAGTWAGAPSRLSARVGTPAFMAPEVWGRNYGQKADIWAAGVSLYWLYTGKYPLYDNPEDITELEAMEDAAYSAPISFSSGPWARMNPAGVELIRRCLSRDETERPTAKEALMHEWFGC